MPTPPFRALACCALLLCTCSAGAQQGLALSCPVCHGGSAASIPGLQDYDAVALANTLRAFRDGDEPGTAMPRLVRALSDAQIDRLAAAVVGSEAP